MKTHITRHLLVLLTGTSLALAVGAENRVMPSDPGADSGNTGSYTPGPGTARENRNTSGVNTTGVGTTGTLAGPDAGSTLKRGDQRFFEKITRLNEREVALSRIAAQRASNPQIRSFAEEMVREHQHAGQELGTLATQKGARLESMSLHDTRETEKDWSDKKGRDYDKAYIKAMIDAHEDTVDVLEDGVDSKDPEIAAAAQKLLPKVKAHLERAESLNKTLD